MNTKQRRPIKLKRQSHAQVYNALLQFAEMFNPNDPDLLSSGITPSQLSEKRYTTEICNKEGFVKVNIESPDVKVVCLMICKEGGE
ncbi:MAG: hypothetical protein ACK5KT_14990 [Dysgonomonas sp.]